MAWLETNKKKTRKQENKKTILRLLNAMGIASPLLLALLWLCSVSGYQLGGTPERDVGARNLERRDMECKPGSISCGQAGCIPSAACCNAAADCELP